MVIEPFLDLRRDLAPIGRFTDGQRHASLADDSCEERDGPVSLRGRVVDAILLWRRELDREDAEATAAPES